MRRVIGIDLHRTFAEVMVWEDGRLRHAGRVDMTRSGLEGFARSLQKSDEVVIEATGNAMVVSHLLTPRVARVVIANPIQVKGDRPRPACEDRQDRRRRVGQPVCCRLPAGSPGRPMKGPSACADWSPDAIRLSRHRTRLKNETHGILHAHLAPRWPSCPTSSAGLGGPALERQVLPDDEHLRHRPPRAGVRPLGRGSGRRGSHDWRGDRRQRGGAPAADRDRHQHQQLQLA